MDPAVANGPSRKLVWVPDPKNAESFLKAAVEDREFVGQVYIEAVPESNDDEHEQEQETEDVKFSALTSLDQIVAKARNEAKKGSKSNRSNKKKKKKKKKKREEEVVNEDEEDEQAMNGRVEWRGIWGDRDVMVTRYPMSKLFDESEQQKAIMWFFEDTEVLTHLRHRCFDSIVGIDRPHRSLVREMYDRFALYPFVKDHAEELSEKIRMSIVLQIAESMEYLHTLEEPITHGHLRVNDLYIQIVQGVVDEEYDHEEDELPPLTTDNVMVRFPGAGLPRRVEGIRNKHPMEGAAAYYPPERLSLDDPEGPEAKDTAAADVWAFGIAAIFVACGELPWAHFQAKEILDKIKKGKRPELPADACPSWAPTIQKCFELDPEERPSFTQIIRLLQQSQVLE